MTTRAAPLDTCSDTCCFVRRCNDTDMFIGDVGRQEEEEGRLHPLPRLCVDVVTAREPWRQL